MDITLTLSTEFGITLTHATNIINLMDEGCTIPFIARYRKELTGSADDQMLKAFEDRLKYLRSLTKRKEEVYKLIDEQGNMTEEIKKALDEAITLTEVEDIYRPFKPKRKTRASVAIAKGLQPLADFILKQANPKLTEEAEKYVNAEKEVNSCEEAIQGAKDIIAEMISDNANLRKILREKMQKFGEIVTKFNPKKAEDEGAYTYEMYANYKSKISQTPSHRILAINRGEKEDFLKVSLELNEEDALKEIYKMFILKNSCYEELLKEVCLDAYKRLVFDSIEREIRNDLTTNANEQAIKMFGVNLRPLLMQPPLKGKVILGLDPGYRTGCKVAVINELGTVLDTGVIYATPGPNQNIEKAEKIVANMIESHNVDVVAIGNGTATKESEIFIANLIKKLNRKVTYAVVNEAGASVYSASKLGAQEFPDYDVALRSAVSIARRLQDPLAELIKIDVKSIGVGQYQHDMPQARLSEVLDGVVESCVNSVGVDVNTASASLLSHVAGLNSAIAKNIEAYRHEKGVIKSREELKKVPKLGEKAFEQCAGFLRVTGGNNILDNTGVHPEAYEATHKLLKYFRLSEEDVKNGNLQLLPKLVEKEGAEKVAQTINVGVPTLNDIVNELLKPGRDVRDELPKPILKSELLSIEDLKPGMVLTGVVRNVIDFGVFVDISVHQDGLVHISEISKDYIKHPSEVLKVGDIVNVKVLSVDPAKKRISLTIKGCDKAPEEN